MSRKFFFIALFFCAGVMPNSWAGDCTQFVSDFKEGKIVSSKSYQFESDQLYLPAAYCPFSPLSYVSDQNSRAEFYIVEQCRETGYKILKTTLVCGQDPKKAKIRSSCDVNGHLLSPCLKNQLAEFLMQTEPS
jgi:hypothetical protein